MNLHSLLRGLVVGALLSGASSWSAPSPANRLTYLDDFCDPFYPDHSFPKLTTPQWIGDPGVEVAVTYGIDDMSGVAAYERYLRPILDRLKQIDGRAPVSIFSNSPRVQEPRLQEWLREGLTFEVHTLSHPCPILGQRQFAAAQNTFHGCVDLLNHIPGNQPLAFRTPCCDSMNTPSPRLFAEIVAATNSAGQFVRMDSSVTLLLTARDPALPPALLVDDAGRSRFEKYVPFPAFTTTIENYPYPYVHTRVLWEMPFVAPSDWQSQNIQGNSNPRLLEDWKVALDLIAQKQGVFNYVFHPAGWSSPTQHVAFIDYATAKYGAKVKFLNYREVHDRLIRNLLAGQPLRAASGGDNGVRLLDLNQDGYLDVLIGNDHLQLTRVWDPAAGRWKESAFPTRFVRGGAVQGVRLGILDERTLVLLVRTPTESGAWRYGEGGWIQDETLLRGLELDGKAVLTAEAGRDRGVRFRDVDGDGSAEVIVGSESQSAVFGWNRALASWQRRTYSLPPGAGVVNAQGQDNGLRFVDLNEDGVEDIILSNEERFSIHLMVPQPVLGFHAGWSRELIAGRHGQLPELPQIVRGGPGRNNGAWFAKKEMWVQNEDVAHLPNIVEHLSYSELLSGLQPPALSPAESLAAIQVPPAFTVELVAAEPVVQDPVYLSWGPDGTLWVVEMRDYPLGINGQRGGVVKRLRDEDGDGRYEKSVVFAENLSFPNGIIPWRKGVLISAAPQLLYAEDTDGDGKADRIEPWFSGFALWNQQHFFNGFEYGLDNWLYGANGDSGGTVQSAKKGTTLSISGRDFRFHPDTGAFEAIAGQTQFGRYRDDWGNWFGNANPIWLWHYWMEDRYVGRNVRLGVEQLRRETAVYPDAGRVFPVGRKQQKMNDVGAAGHVTSANSPTPYRDELFGPEFARAVFISEPVHNLIHCEILRPEGVTFTSSRWNSAEPRDFLTSTDTWFRPTGMKVGPDGALYVADMYRQYIEHPEWIPEDVKRRVNLRAGEDKGRIYRVFPKGSRLRTPPDLTRLGVGALAKALDHPNGWQRDTVQRMLVTQGDPAAVQPLQALVRHATQPQARLQALCTLDGLAALAVADVEAALSDSHPSVREHAVRLAEQFLREPRSRPADAITPGQQEGLARALLSKVDDPEIRVRFQLALTLGEWRDSRAAEFLARLALKDQANPDLITAVMSSVAHNPVDVFQSLVASGQDLSPLERLTSHLGEWIAARANPEVIASVFAQLGRPAASGGVWAPWQISTFAQLLQELEKGKRSLAEFPAAAETLPRLLASSRELVAGESTPQPLRLAAMSLLGRDPSSESQDAAALSRLLLPQVAPKLQGGALSRLAQLRSDEVAGSILKSWSHLTPTMRQQSLDVLLRRDSWSRILLDRVAAKEIAPADLGASTQQRLLSHADDRFRSRAREVLAQPVNVERQKLVGEYLPQVLALSGRVESGAATFAQHCAVCHRLRGQGTGVAPDLASLVDRSPERLLVAILDPNRAVEDRYVSYVARTKGGEELSGLLMGESANSITLVNASGSRETILRADLESLASTRLSLMPEGFEQWIKPQGIADLIAYLEASSLAPRKFAGNLPSVVTKDDFGAFRCRAVTAEIYGDGIAFEPQYQNLGSWNGAQARAVWTLDVPAPGVYSVWLQWACHENEAGDTFRFQVGDQSVAGKVPSTRTWDLYEARSFGRIEVPAGKLRAVFQADLPLNGYLIDLAEVRLVPVQLATPRFERPGQQAAGSGGN